jgi:beta-barrel assembly-enhancing protease
MDHRGPFAHTLEEVGTMKTRLPIGLAVVLVGALPAGPSVAQTIIKDPRPGFNLFSVQQDVELGRQSAVEAEKQLRLLNSQTTNTYLNRIVQRLSSAAPGARYPYRIKAVNAPEINAFALPGGPMYVNRGLLEAARNEGELAGVLAHEMAHVAMRHGTHQASKAYLSQAGLGILGGLLGKSSGTSKIVNAIGGVGLNAVFLKFSRDDEYEADQVGAQIMARAGYNPVAMANFFDLLQSEQGRDPNKVERFFSDHPPTADRQARIRQLAGSLGSGRTEVVGGFTSVRAGLQRLPAAGQQSVGYVEAPRDTVYAGQIRVQVEEPSSRLVRFEQPNGFFSIDRPENWEAYPSGNAVSMAPRGGVVTTADGKQIMVYGVIVNHYTPFAGDLARRSQSLARSYAPFEDRSAPRGSLEDATDDLIRTILETNSYLEVQGQVQAVRIDQAPGFRITLAGRSPATGEEERVILYTRGLDDNHVVYALSVAPGRDSQPLEQTFDRMLLSLRINDNAAHRSTGLSSGSR